ncbi:MAG: acyltransferase [Acidobacteria bacterium]|nr:acyltransferase [Acidobacteriota bacterium]
MPGVPRAVMIIAPHTSNWDFLVGISTMLALDLDLSFLAKHTLFRWPLGPVMRFLGGIPVDRTQPRIGTVGTLAARFKSSDRLILALSPEGTRRTVERWHTGFHRIAKAAGVPIIPVALDYRSHTVRFGEPYTPTPDLDHDLARLQAFFAAVEGRRRSG